MTLKQGHAIAAEHVAMNMLKYMYKRPTCMHTAVRVQTYNSTVITGPGVDLGL